MTIYGIVVLLGIDNVLKPILIAKSGKLPVLVLFLGVIGGMTAWGFTGMFKGAIILAIPSFSAGLGGQAIGIVLCLMSTFVFALAFNITRSFARLAPQSVAALAMTGAMLATLPAAIIFEGIPEVLRNETWLAWLALGLFPTAFTFQVMYWMLPKVGATNFSVNAYISPIVATILGVSILGETVSPFQLIGIAVVMSGLIIIDGRLLSRWVPAPQSK